MNNCAELDKGNFDFLCSPIDSIICMQNIFKPEANISKQVGRFYEEIKKDLMEALMKSYERCVEKISRITDRSKNAFTIIQKLAGMSSKEWNIEAKTYY